MHHVTVFVVTTLAPGIGYIQTQIWKENAFMKIRQKYSRNPILDSIDKLQFTVNNVYFFIST